MTDPPDLTQQFRDFYLREKDALLSYAASQPPTDYTSEDLLQEAIEKAWRRLCRNEKYHAYKWFPWIRSLIRWTALDKRRRHKKSPVVPANDTFEEGDDFLANTAGNTQSPAEIAIQTERNHQLTQALLQMGNEQERHCLELLYFDSANHPTLLEVAHTLGIKPSSITQTHKRAKASLKEKLRFTAPQIKSATNTPDHES